MLSITLSIAPESVAMRLRLRLARRDHGFKCLRLRLARHDHGFKRFRTFGSSFSSKNSVQPSKTSVSLAAVRALRVLLASARTRGTHRRGAARAERTR